MIDDDKKPLTSEQFIKIYRRKQRGKSKQSMNMQGQSLYPFPDSEKFKSLQQKDQLARERQMANEISPEEERQGLIQLVSLDLKGEKTKQKAVEQD